MTGKEEIIDGIDVSKCDRYIKNDGYMGIYNTPVFKGDCMLHHIGKCQGSECLFKRFKRKEYECEKLKEINQYLINTHCHFKNELKKYKKAVHKYKITLLNKIKQLLLRRRELLEEINCALTRITYKDEEFKNVLDKFNNDILVMNNEDRHKQALDEIEEFCKQVAGKEAYINVDYILSIINKAKKGN